MSFDKKAWMKANMPAYRKKNRDKIKQQEAAYRALHKEDYYKWGSSWRENNKEYVASRMAKWAKENPDKIKANHANTYRRHRDKIKAATKAYYLKNKSVQDEKARIWRENNKEKIHARHQEWYKHNSHISILCANRRRAKQANAAVGNQAVILKWEKAWRSKKKVICYWCQTRNLSSNCHSDHIVAIDLGGPHSIDNLCISCQPCNSRKHAKPMTKWIKEISQPTLLL